MDPAALGAAEGDNPPGCRVHTVRHPRGTMEDRRLFYFLPDRDYAIGVGASMLSKRR